MTVSIRPATSADAAAIAAIYAEHVVSGYATFELDPPAAAEFARRMLARPRLPWLVAEDDRSVSGFAFAGRHRERAAYRWSADVSIYLAADATGRGTGRSLYVQLLPAVAALGYVSVFAGIALPNPASVALHEAMGFTQVGIYRDVGFKLGEWRDVGWYQRRLLDPPPADPPEPGEWVARRL
jgi:L-amino acid N-acyltransferase YncA